MKKRVFRAVVIGASAGGFGALKALFGALKGELSVPVLVVQHLGPDAGDFLARHLDAVSRIRVKEADEKERLQAGTAYIAPPNYHLLAEADETLSLSTDARVNYSRPSIDVLFESAADAFGGGLIGIILTGANSDGSAGLKRIGEAGGLTVVQAPKTAEVSVMPQAALDAVGEPDYVLELGEIAELLNRIC